MPAGFLTVLLLSLAQVAAPEEQDEERCQVEGHQNVTKDIRCLQQPKRQVVRQQLGLIRLDDMCCGPRLGAYAWHNVVAQCTTS